MRAHEKNDLVKYAINQYSHVITTKEAITLESFADAIEKVYDMKTSPTRKIACTWLRGTDGTVKKDITGKVIAKYIQHTD